MHIVEHLVTHLNALSCLVKSIFVSMNLGKDGTVLQLELANYEDLSHSVRDAFFFEIEHTCWHLLESMFNALSTFFKHLHLLVAESHVMKHYEEMINISPT
jgi:hypothetical protein